MAMHCYCKKFYTINASQLFNYILFKKTKIKIKHFQQINIASVFQLNLLIV